MKNIVVKGLAQAAFVNAVFESCTTSIERMKEGPEEFDQIMQMNHGPYEDFSFSGRGQLYWVGITDWGKIMNYESDLGFGSYAFQKLSDVHPDATMWGDNNPSWKDIMQGSAGTCYIEASLGAIAEFPDLVKNVFITQETNPEGIYAFRFYIRGKPWIVTVDDYFLFKDGSGGSREGVFAKVGPSKQFWAMLLEKAWAKVKGTYEHADGGFVQNGLRALIGCPVYSYLTSNQNADTVFAVLKRD